MPRILVVASAVLGLFVFAAPAFAQWGTLKGQIVLDGDVPEIKPLIAKGDQTAKDAAVCAAQSVPNEALAIDEESKGIANVVIWLAKKPATIHPELVEPKDATVTFDQVGCKFIPHVLVVRDTQTVKVVSGDPIAHNTRGNPIRNQGFNFIVAPNDRVGNPVELKQPERLPVQIGCDIHNWMRAWWLVLDHPYGAVTDKEGKFEIPNLPEGEHEFKVWHETPGYLVKNAKNPKKGLIVKIKSGETTEIEPIKVKLSTLEGKAKK
jgi:hypothetical protein